MDDRMVKCSEFLRDLGLAASIVGMLQTSVTAVAIIMRMLRCCTGEDGGQRWEERLKNLFGYV